MGTNNTSNATPDQSAATTPSSRSPDPAALRLGHIHGVVVQVRDLERSLAFYRDVLGFRVDENDGMPAMLRVAGEGVPTLALSETGFCRVAHAGFLVCVTGSSTHHSGCDRAARAQVFITGGFDFDMVTFALDASTGAGQWASACRGHGISLAVGPVTGTVFVTGCGRRAASAVDCITIAYRG